MIGPWVLNVAKTPTAFALPTAAEKPSARAIEEPTPTATPKPAERPTPV
jgi:hypothetical protein